MHLVVVGAVAAVVILWWVVRPVVSVGHDDVHLHQPPLHQRGRASSPRRAAPSRSTGSAASTSRSALIDRLFGCGTLVVSDASEQGRVELDDIPHVEEVQLKVADELHRLSGRRGSDDGT